jgi:regulator of sigma E protease
MTIIVFLIILGVLVLIHELGHFIAAKKQGIMVEEFGFGYPPRIFGIKKGETLYSINLIPIGGFVKLYGEEYDDVDRKRLINKERAFSYKKPWQKSLVVVAGAVGNFILGWILISCLFIKGIPAPTDRVIVEQVQKNSPAAEAGFLQGDVVIKINDQITVSPANKKHIVLKGENLWIISERYYKTGEKFGELTRINNIRNPNIIYVDQVIDIPNIIQEKQQEYAIKSSDNLIDLTKKLSGKKITMTIVRKGKERNLTIIPRKNPPNGQGPLGIVITNFVEKKYPWYQAPFYGLIEAFNITRMIVVELIKTILLLLSFKKPSVDITGPIGIARFTGQAIKFGSNAIMELVALLSLNLAVVNLLPFPALDGGHLVLNLYEWVTRRRVNKTFEKYLNFLGFILLLTVAVLISVNDIIKIYK